MDLSVFIDKDEACGVIDMVTKLLQQQLANGWIPVSERLPNIGETVLLTVAVNRGISHEYGSVDIAWICDKENKCFYGTDGKYSHDEAIAWQPLPEPYKEASNAKMLER